MKTITILTLGLFLASSAGAQQKRPPSAEIKAQTEHVKSSGNDLLHLRFKKAHEKHVAEMNRRNAGIAKDLRGEGQPLPKPKPLPKPRPL